MNGRQASMVALRRAREVVNPALRGTLGRVPRRQWPGVVMNYLGSGASIMVGKGETAMLCGIFQESTVRDFATAVGPQGRIIVVEANPANTRRLQTALASSGNVEIVNAAVWHTDTPLEFEFADQAEAQHYNRVRDSTLQSFPTHMVAAPEIVNVDGERLTTTMDRFGIDVVDHLNLTINGAEEAAFRGAQGEAAAERVRRIYAHTELPDPGVAFENRLLELGFRTRKSGRLNSRNPAIDLRRLYAWR